MINKLLTFLIVIVALLGLSTGTISAATNPFQTVCQQAGAKSSNVCTNKNTNPIYGPTGIIVKVTKVVALITGVMAVIFIMIGGFMYITSGGDSNRVNSAKNTILYALIGVVVILAAQSIIIFVVDRL